MNVLSAVRLSDSKNANLSFEFTRDGDFIKRYLAIYEQEFRLTHNLPGYRTVAGEDDHRSHILIVRQGDECVGGARLSIKTPEDDFPLPIEMDGFKLDHHFPYLKEQKLRYGQVGRFCLLPAFRGGVVTRAMFRCLYEEAKCLDLNALFGTAIIALARAQKISLLQMGLRDVQIYPNIELPEYPMCEGVKFLLFRGVIGERLGESTPTSQ